MGCLSPSGDPESVAGEYGRHSLYKMLGYFSLVGLLRLHSLLGDYYQAIKVLENIELNKKVTAGLLRPSPRGREVRLRLLGRASGERGLLPRARGKRGRH